MIELERRLRQVLYKKSLYEFVKAFWSEADPSKFVDGKLIQLYCEVFQYMCRGWVGYTKPEVILPQMEEDSEFIDLIQDKKYIDINVPPRHTKSMIFNVIGPTWASTNYPVKAVSISHTEGLAKKMNEKRQKIINSQKFSEIFDYIKLVQNSATSLIDSRGGELYSQNRNAMTGYGGDIIINDDLTNARTAKKDMEEMSNAWAYYQDTMPSRINDINNCIIMNIQQRLAPNDISGHIRNNPELAEKYIFLTLPAQFDKTTYIVCPISGEVLCWKKGEYLWPERFGDYASLKASVGQSTWETQYLQKPVASDSTVIKENMIIEVDEKEAPGIEYADMIYASHDFPVKDKETSDNLGSVVGYKVAGTLYITDALEKKMAFTKSIQYVRAVEEIYPGIIQVIEDKANGAPILQQLSEEVSGLHGFQPGSNSKMQRLESASLYMPSIKFVKNEFNKLTNRYNLSPELQNLKHQLIAFPFLEHDDVVDAFSMLVLFVFMDKKYKVYGRSFNADNLITDMSKYEDLYENLFFNKEGDIWKVCKISVEYRLESKLIIKDEMKFKASIEEAADKIKEFADENKLLIDCSNVQSLYGNYLKDIYIERESIEDFDKSVTSLNLALDKKLILVNKKCSGVRNDIDNFKFSKSKDENVKYQTEKDGFVSCIRCAMKYYGIH